VFCCPKKEKKKSLTLFSAKVHLVIFGGKTGCRHAKWSQTFYLTSFSCPRYRFYPNIAKITEEELGGVLRFCQPDLDMNTIRRSEAQGIT
jgi:hypothetical protein